MQLKHGSLGRKSSTQTGQKLSIYQRGCRNVSPCEIRSLLDYDRGQCAESSYLEYFATLDSRELSFFSSRGGVVETG